MGIKGFKKWLKTFCPESFITLESHKKLFLDHIHIDVNPILHQYARVSWADKDLHQKVDVKIAKLIRYSNARKSMHFCYDGIAPLGKLALQMSRREENFNSAMKSGRFDSQKITPGCLFMGLTEVNLKRLIMKELWHPRCERSLICIVDGSSVCGEGEDKIFNRIMEQSIEKQDRETSGILSADSDCLLRSIVMDIPGVFVFDPFVDDGECFSADIFHQTMQKRFGQESRRIILDLCLLVSFTGNDCLPALYGYGFAPIWHSYMLYVKQTGSFLIDPSEHSLNLDSLRIFLEYHRQKTTRDYMHLEKYNDPQKYLECVLGSILLQINGNIHGDNHFYSSGRVSVQDILRTTNKKVTIPKSLYLNGNERNPGTAAVMVISYNSRVCIAAREK